MSTKMRRLVLVVISAALMCVPATSSAHVVKLGDLANATRVQQELCTTHFTVSDYRHYASKVYKRTKVSKAAHNRMRLMHICVPGYEARKKVGALHDKFKAQREVLVARLACSNYNPRQCAINAATAFGISSSWLIACALDEGGLGPSDFDKMNYGGSGAGGNWQFMSGTFFGHVNAALARVGLTSYIKRRWGGIIWLNSEQQAYTAAYMFSIGQSGQWTGAGC